MAHSGKSDQLSDRELVGLCNHGDAAEAGRAFGALYERHKNFVLRVALRFARDNEIALDVLQETFGYLLRKFPPTGPGLELTAQLSTLLYPVAKNTAITMLRKARRFPVAEDRDPDQLPSRTSRDAQDTDDIAVLLGELSAEHREVVLLRFVDDLSLNDIAAALGIPVGTVKSRLHHAIRQLRNSPAVRKTLEP